MPSNEINKLSNIQLVQFDLDGTLLDSLPQLWQAVNIMLNQLGFAQVTAEVVQLWIGNGADKLVERALTDALGQTPSEREQQAARSGFDAAYDSVAEHKIVLYPGVLDTLSQLNALGKTLALVTNKPYRFVPAILASAGIDGYFSHVLGGDSLAQKKPDPAPLLHVCQTLNIAPEHSIMVGDSENDVLAAKAAGMRVVGLTYGYNYGRNIADSKPDWVLDNIQGLLDLLKS
ncbi:phosphoglycolate phosphatase [Oceanisphaera sp. W20_SRM_FM3]|uniref:phosphoglycolate phosphatase n=1 Tax=Oceanisphaera sp. W20_SRM_FM3 TaxID=3240267 RepID=UPI003F99DDAB